MATSSGVFRRIADRSNEGRRVNADRDEEPQSGTERLDISWLQRIQGLLGTGKDDQSLAPPQQRGTAADSGSRRARDTVRIRWDRDSGEAPQRLSPPRPAPAAELPRELAGAITMAEMIERYGKLSGEDFQARFPHPFLVQLSIDPEQRSAVVGDTKVFNRERAMQWNFKERSVFPVVTESGGLYIAIGRGDDNDIVIPQQAVSKFHAAFAHKDGEWLLADRKSTNGTFVGGIKVVPGAPVEVGDGSEIALADTAIFLFCTPIRIVKFMELLG